jgi:UDP-N-acetylmuramate: L-alanyl-gamma-D-glutamyl-meso-diaminopimelate ligase
LEKRPKFHFLFPHIAVLTGIAWDHINVFPTFDNYLEQFRIFLQKLEPGGSLVYNMTDPVLHQLVQDNLRTDITLVPYGVPQHTIQEGTTTIEINGEQAKLKVFGAHNLMNLHAAWLVCRQLGVDARQFVQAMSSFTGAAKRLELLARNGATIVYRDFAHAPSKVKATVEAARQQYPERKIVALLELHTYSSLNEQFMQEYQGALDGADAAAVFYSKHALELKRMPELPKAAVITGFGKEGLQVLHTKAEIEQWLDGQHFANSVVLLMSSGNYDGLDVAAFAKNITTSAA